MKAPTISELIEAVRERMDGAAERPVGGFEARVIRNVLAIVERELDLGPTVEAERTAILADFGAADEIVLAAAIRSGDHDDRSTDLRSRLLALSRSQLEIDNPRW